MSLLELADRVEAATALEQRAILIDAAEASLIANGHDPDTEEAMGWLDRFETLIAAGAYLDAAMTLVPEGWTLSQLLRSEDRERWSALLWVHDPNVDLRSNAPSGDAKTPELSITAAALRALASTQEAASR
jgi:hypothetical protein